MCLYLIKSLFLGQYRYILNLTIVYLINDTRSKMYRFLMFNIINIILNQFKVNIMRLQN